MRTIRSLIIVGIILAASSAQAAQITAQPPQKGSVLIVVHDVIVNGDAERLEQMLRQATANHQHAAVYLDSRGGDVDVSMDMGHIIRRYGADTYNGYCASACAYVFLGGVNRYVSTDVNLVLYIHRPELAEAYIKKPSYGARQMLDVLRGYIAEMTGDLKFYDVMMTTPFSEPRALTPNEALMLHVATAVGN